MKLLLALVTCASIIYASGEMINVSMSQKIEELKSEASKIHTRSAQAKKVMDEFESIAENQKDLVFDYEKEKASCRNLEDKYKNSSSKFDSVRKLKEKKIANCYSTLKIITLNFSIIDSKFVRLKSKIEELTELAEVDQGTLNELESRLNILEKLQSQNQKFIDSKIAEYANKTTSSY